MSGVARRGPSATSRQSGSYVRYFVSRIEMLTSNGVVPIVIFDGCRLPLKADEEESRRRCARGPVAGFPVLKGRVKTPQPCLAALRGRSEALERARQHAENGNASAAKDFYQRAVDVAPWMAKVVMEVRGQAGRCWL
jgi:exonuclease-1